MSLFLRFFFPFFARLIPNGTILPILRGPLKGMKWIAGAAAGPSKGLSVIAGASEPKQLKAAAKLISNDSICFDIGANVGIYTLLFGRYSKKVYAFEPLETNIYLLNRTIEVNSLSNVAVIPKAVSDTNGVSHFAEGTSNSVGKLDPNGNLTVETISLDSFCDLSNVVPDIIKIDVEGTEEKVLKGGMEVLRYRKPAILLSTHGDTEKLSTFRLLREIGYNFITPINDATLERASEFMCK